MQNKIMLASGLIVALFAAVPLRAAEEVELEVVEIAQDEVDMDELSADVVAAYPVEGSLFQQITDLEQEKVLMQLEKERAQLDLELDRLAAEKIKLHMEIDTLSGRAEQQQQEIETERAKLEAEAARLEKEKERLMSADDADTVATPKATSRAKSAAADGDVLLNEKYRLVNVVGAGNQLQATVADLDSGQNKRLAVGKTLDGYTVKSISLDEGIVFEKDSETQTLNVIGKE